MEGAKALKKKDKKEIEKIANEKKLRFAEKNIFAHIDPTGNQAVVSAIQKATNHAVSTAKSSVINYTISHIWEGTTHNPLFFSSLWNIVIIPNFLNYIMDKPKEQDVINEQIQETMKAICFKLYNPNQIMKSYVEIQEPKAEFLTLADKAIKEGWVQYLPEREVVSEEIFIENLKISEDNDFENELDTISQLSNKEFIFSLLDFCVEYGIFEDLLPILMDKELCKEYFLQAYAVLVPSEKQVDSKRYYTEKLFEYQGHTFYLTNDWYSDNSKNARKNRTPFVAMIRKMVEER